MPKLCAINVSGGGHKHGHFFQNYKADLGQMPIIVRMDVSQLQEKVELQNSRDERITASNKKNV